MGWTRGRDEFLHSQGHRSTLQGQFLQYFVGSLTDAMVVIDTNVIRPSSRYHSYPLRPAAAMDYLLPYGYDFDYDFVSPAHCYDTNAVYMIYYYDYEHVSRTIYANFFLLFVIFLFPNV